MSTQPVLLFVAAVLGGVGVELIRALFGRKRMNADTAKSITDAAIALLKPLEDRVNELEPLRNQVRRLERELEEVHLQLREATRRAERAESRASRAAELAEHAEARAERTEARDVERFDLEYPLPDTPKDPT